MDVFFLEDDRRVYMELLAEYAERYGVYILAYCLMTNHVHHILVPLEKNSLAQTLKSTHMRYSSIINGRNAWKGHLWQERYFSSPLDEDYFWAALRYVERNPVEANLVEHPSHYPWSSAAAHCGFKNNLYLDRESEWAKKISAQEDWYEWLAKKEDEKLVKNLKAQTYRDLPSGNEGFLALIEKKTGRKLPKFKRRISA
jgi:putative transposase